MVTINQNPYQSPNQIDSRESTVPFLVGGKARGTLLEQGLLYRRIAIESPIQAMLEFMGRSIWRDMIFINGKIVDYKISWLKINSRFEFYLPTTHSNVKRDEQALKQDGLKVEVDLRVGRFLKMSGFQLKIADEVVYAEGEFEQQD